MSLGSSMKPPLILMVQMLWVATLPVGSAPAFGSVPYTIDGYDVDNGTEPICWTYPLQYNFSGNTEVWGRDFQMMPFCYPRTNMQITVDGLELFDSVQTLFTQRNYTVNLEISVDFETIEKFAPEYFDDYDDNNNSSYTVEGGRYTTSNQVLFRIALCDVTKIGFCNPVALDFLESYTENLTEYTQTSLEDLWVTDGEFLAPYEEGTVLKGVSLGNHIYSRWIMLELDPMDSERKLYSTNETLIIQVPEGNAGTFFVVGHGHLELQLNDTNNNSSDSGILLDVASAIPDNVVFVKPPPTLLTVSTAIKVAVGVASGICAVLALLILVFIVYNRGHAVMKLSQWGMLTWLVSCALISFVFMFTYLPTNEWHCRFSEFFELIPMTMIGAILAGRVWRIYVTLSPAMSIGKDKKEKGQTVTKFVIGTLTQIARFPYGCRELGQENKGFRAKATTGETIRLVLVLCTPQLIVQIVGLAVYDKGLDYDFDDDGSIGIIACSDEGTWVRRVGVMLMWFMYTLALILAWVGRDLPAAFNDTDAIFQSASINALVSLITITLDMLTTTIRTAPDVTVFLWVCSSIVISSTAVYFITVPKIKRVVSGEKVIISDLLKQARTSEHSTSHPAGETSILQSGKNLASSRLPNGERPTIHVKRNDPIPRKLERELLGVNEMVEGIRNELIEGRTPNLSEWQQLIGKVEELNEDLHRTQFDWTEENETDNR